MLNDINVVVSTVQREENYLKTTLDSITADQPIISNYPISLVLGTPTTTHVENYQPQTNIDIIKMPPDTWSMIRSFHAMRRAAWNCYRCLTLPVAGPRGTLALEDDVLFARGWLPRLNTIINQLEHLYGTDFVLSIYAPWAVAKQENNQHDLFVKYSPAGYLGMQGIYYTSKTRQEFAKYFKNHVLVGQNKLHDLYLTDYLIQAKIPLFASSPSLVQHTGRKSSLDSPWHDSQMFTEDITQEQ